MEVRSCLRMPLSREMERPAAMDARRHQLGDEALQWGHALRRSGFSGVVGGAAVAVARVLKSGYSGKAEQMPYYMVAVTGPPGDPRRQESAG